MAKDVGRRVDRPIRTIHTYLHRLRPSPAIPTQNVTVTYLGRPVGPRKSHLQRPPPRIADPHSLSGKLLSESGSVCRGLRPSNSGTEGSRRGSHFDHRSSTQKRHLKTRHTPGVVLYARNASRPRVIRKCHNHVDDASTPTGSEIGRLHPSCVQSPNPNTKRQRRHSDLHQYTGRADRNPQSRSPLTSRHHERTAYKPSAPRSLALTKLVM